MTLFCERVETAVALVVLKEVREPPRHRAHLLIYAKLGREASFGVTLSRANVAELCAHLGVLGDILEEAGA